MDNRVTGHRTEGKRRREIRNKIDKNQLGGKQGWNSCRSIEMEKETARGEESEPVGKGRGQVNVSE